KRVEADLAEAQRFKDESDVTILAREKALADAHAHAQTLANETHKKAAAAAEARRKEVDAKLAGRIAEGGKDHCRYAIRRRREGAWCCERGRGRNRRTADRHCTGEPRGQRSRQQRAQALRKPTYDKLDEVHGCYTGGDIRIRSRTSAPSSGAGYARCLKAHVWEIAELQI